MATCRTSIAARSLGGGARPATAHTRCGAVRRPRTGQAIKTYSTAQKHLAHTGPVVGPPPDGPRGWRTCAGADASADATPAARGESGRAWANRRAVVPGRHGVFSRQLSTVRRLSAGGPATRAAAPPATCRRHRRRSLAPAPPGGPRSLPRWCRHRAPRVRSPLVKEISSVVRVSHRGAERWWGGACPIPPNRCPSGPALARARRNTVVGAPFHRTGDSKAASSPLTVCIPVLAKSTPVRGGV